MSAESEADLPDYAPMLAAYHRGFARQLRRMIAALPIRSGMRVMDMACGDGAYSVWLAGRVGPTGEVVAVDIDPAFLGRAREAAAASNVAAPILHVAAPLEAMPFEPASFDAIWCAQSLYSLPDPLATLRTLRPFLKPGGHLAVLENDTLHHLLLPWPIEVELALRSHEYRALSEETGQPRKYYAARRLARLFRAAGFEDVRFRTYATDLRGPLEGDARTFVAKYLRELRGRVDSRLDLSIGRELERLVDPASEDFLLDDPDFVATCLDRVVWGAVPGT